jgi:RNA polymerase sigma factor (sigma-70 family)
MPPSPSTPAAAGTRPALSDDDRARVRAGWEAGRAKNPAVAVLADVFEARVADLAGQRWRAQGLDPTPERVAAFVAGASLADVYLTTACEAGDARAWEAFTERYQARLEAYAAGRRGSAADPEAVVAELLAELSKPPPRGASRTLIGTFDGTGSFVGWLSIVLLRRIAARARAKSARSINPPDAAEPRADEPTLPRGEDARPAEGPTALATPEAAAAFMHSLNRAWRTLSTQQRLALVLNYRDRWTKRRIGEALGVGEDRVSRVVAAGVGRLSLALTVARDTASGADADAIRQVFAAAITRRLASSGPADAPLGKRARAAAPSDELPGSSGGVANRPARPAQPPAGESPR